MGKTRKYYYIPFIVEGIEKELKTLQEIYEKDVKEVKSTDFIKIQEIKAERNYFDALDAFLKDKSKGMLDLAKYLKRNEYPSFKFVFIQQEIMDILQGYKFMGYHEAEITSHIILAIAYGFSGDLSYEDYTEILKRQSVSVYTFSEEEEFKEFWRQMLLKIHEMSDKMFKISDTLAEKM